MEYPADLLPKSNYRIIEDSLNRYSLIRRTDSGEIFDSSTGLIKNDYIVPFNFHNRHFLNWSCNMYGHFRPEYFKYRITSSEFNEYWSGDGDDEPEEPLYGHDFIIDEDFGFYFIPITTILSNLKIPYEKEIDGKKVEGLIAEPYIDHCPTLANFWHFEIRWEDDEGNKINPRNKSAWVKTFYNSIKNAIRQYCTANPGDSIYTEVPREYFIKPLD